MITRPGDVAGGLLTLPETVSRQLKEGLTQGYEQLRDWETLSPAARQQRVDTLVQQGVVTVLREGIIILTVKAAGRTVEITLREVDDTRWTISRMRTDRTEVILEREARPAVGPGRVTRAEPAALGRGAEAPAQSTGRRVTAASAAEQATPPIRMRRIIVQDSAGKPVLRYEPEVISNASPNRGIEWVIESPTTKNQAVLDYQASAGGARFSIAAHKPEVPALRYDNLNPNGKNLVRFDGLEGNTLIDRKFSITSKSKQLEDLRRMGRALSQNPEYLGRIEVPTQAIANRAKKILENLGIQNIDVKVVVP